MPYDALLTLQPAVAVAAAGTTNGPDVDLRNGTPRRGMVARVIVTALAGTGAPALNFKVQHSNDAGATDPYVDLAFDGFGPVAAPGEFDIRFSTRREWVRLVCVATGTTVTAAYSGDLGIAFP